MCSWSFRCCWPPGDAGSRRSIATSSTGSTELLYGPNQPLVDSDGVSFYRVPHALSVAFGIWGFFILLFFIHREDKDAERMSKIIGTIASGLFVLNYDTIINYAVRFAGPGAGNQSVAALISIATCLLLALVVLKAFASAPRPVLCAPEEPRPT